MSQSTILNQKFPSGEERSITMQRVTKSRPAKSTRKPNEKPLPARSGCATPTVVGPMSDRMEAALAMLNGATA